MSARTDPVRIPEGKHRPASLSIHDGKRTVRYALVVHGVNETHGFELERVTTSSKGSVLVRGFVALPARLFRSRTPDFQVGIQERESSEIHWVDVRVVQRLRTGLIVEADIGRDHLPATRGLGDVFFRQRSNADRQPQRVAFPTRATDWLAYPTKYGNLSLKRIAK